MTKEKKSDTETDRQCSLNPLSARRVDMASILEIARCDQMIKIPQLMEGDVRSKDELSQLMASGVARSERNS